MKIQLNPENSMKLDVKFNSEFKEQFKELVY